MRLRKKIKNTGPGSLLLAENRHKGRLEETSRFTAEVPTPSIIPRLVWPEEATSSKDGEQSVSQTVSACGWGPRAERHSQAARRAGAEVLREEVIGAFKGLPRWLKWWRICLPMQEMKETRVQSLGREDPWKRKWLPTPVPLPGESHGQRSLVGCSPWGHKVLNMTCHAQTHTHPKEHLHDWDVIGQGDAINYLPSEGK